MPSNSDRRERILHAAIDCFIRKGFHATSMRDIAQAASVSLGNLYNYFPGKDALIAEVANQEQAELQPLLQALHQTASPTLEQVHDALSDYASLCCQRDWAVLSAECFAEIARNPALAPAFEANRKQLLHAFASVLERGAQQGSFSLAAPAALIAQILLDAIESDALRRALSTATPMQQHTTIGALHPGVLNRMLLGMA